MTDTLVVALTPLEDLKPHPRNYRVHPDAQIDHLVESLDEHGFYRNIVVARDGTILAGHGIVEAARRSGIDRVPVHRVDLDPDEPRALKLLAADNELARFAEIDDRQLSEILRDVRDQDIAGLLGTGYDDAMLANLVMVTRPASEIADFDEAAEWVGMPEYDPTFGSPLRLTVSFADEEDRAKFLTLIGANASAKAKSLWWPARENDDVSSLAFVDES